MRVLLTIVLLLASCGPSHRRLARAKWVYDECRYLDEDPYIHPETKQRCWEYWLAQHDYHQPASRIEHARERARVNAEATSAPPEDAGGPRDVLPPGAGPPPSAPPQGSPGEGGGGEPPIVEPGGGLPPIVPSGPPGAPGSPGTAEAPAAQTGACPDECRALWRQCREACGSPREGADACLRTCNGVLSDCIQDCRR